MRNMRTGFGTRTFTVSGRWAWHRWAAAAIGAALAAALGACGGGNEGAFVSAISASPTQFSKLTVISVSGVGLDGGVVLRADSGCDNPTELPGGSSQARRFTCTLSAVGPLALRVENAAGTRIGLLRFEVPQPQVTLRVSGLEADDRTMVLTLDALRAPLSVRNFLSYVNAGFYAGSLFHRVDPGNGVVQAGGFTVGPTLKAATNAPIALESANGLSNLRGSVGMARTSAPDSATSQFYFNARDNPAFDYQGAESPGYAVFGAITQGLEVMDAIFALPTGSATVLGADGAPLLDANGLPVQLTTVPQGNVTIKSASQTR